MVGTTAAIIMAASAATTAGAQVYSAKKQSSAARDATRAQTASTDAQLQYLREQSAREEQTGRAQWDADQALRAPYRAASAQVLSSVTGVPVPAYTGTGGGTSQYGDTSEYESQFNQLTNGRAGTPQDLTALESDLAARGMTVMRNASGTAGKVRLPSGEIVDVVTAAGAGGQGWQWLRGPGPGASGASAGSATSGIRYDTPRQTGGATLAAGGGGFGRPAGAAQTPGLTIEDMLARRY